MAGKAKILYVFLGSPGDVSPERRASARAIAKVSQTIAEAHGYIVREVMWERDVLPSYGKDPQAIINERLGDLRAMDLCVFILRDRIGTRTPRDESGTAEEYALAVAARKGRKHPEIWACFGKQTPGLKGAHAIQQAKARRFRERITPRHVRFDFGTTAQFREEFERLLGTWVSEYLAGEAKRGAARKPGATGGHLTSANAILLGDRVYRTARPQEEAGRLVARIIVETPTEDRALRKLAEGFQTVPYAFGLVGGRVRVSRVEFTEEKGRAMALVRFDSPQTSGSGYGHFGNDSQMETSVRRILLDEAEAKKEPLGLGTRAESLVPVVSSILKRGTDAATRLEAKLWAVQAILEQGLVSEIKQLTISARVDKGVKISFTGIVRSGWGAETKPVRVEGWVLPRKRKTPAKPKKT